MRELDYCTSRTIAMLSKCSQKLPDTLQRELKIDNVNVDRQGSLSTATAIDSHIPAFLSFIP